MRGVVSSHASEFTVSQPAKTAAGGLSLHPKDFATPRRGALLSNTADSSKPAGAEPIAVRKLIFLCTEDWYFWSHRMPIARAARDAGFQVLVLTRIQSHGQRIQAEGFD